MTRGEIDGWHFATRKAVRLRWAEGRITHLEALVSSPPPDQWIAPGLFDLQVNGYGGVDFQQDDLTQEDMLKAIRGLRSAGCTRSLATLITNDWPVLMHRLRRMRALRSQSAELQAAIAGWHIEGPFLSPAPGFRGAHDPAWMRDPAPADILELRAIAGDDPVLLTLAPERTGALKAIEVAVSEGIVVSLGHTDASAEILRQAVQAGARAFTHLGNGCPRALDRHDNILWRIFETSGLMVSLIPDKIHVSAPLFRLAHRVLGPESIYYTTDAMSAAGARPGRYKLGKLELEVGADQIVRQPGSQLFAGSALRPIEGVFRAAQMLGCSWQEVWPRFSMAPGNLLGMQHDLVVGQPADFCLLKVSAENQLVDLSSCVFESNSVVKES
jgi:N-acetylglucosamine-6-phosphate deacetylase